MSTSSGVDVPQLELYGARTGNCLRAAIGLEEAGLAYGVRHVSLSRGEQRTPAHLARQPSIHETLNIALISAREGAVVVEARPSESHLNPAGTVAGGYIATILDAACGCAAHTALPPDTAYTTLELKLSYHRAITPDTGKLRAEGKLLSSGRRAAFSEAKLFDETGRLLASASSSLLVLPLRGEEPLGSAGPVPPTRELP